MSRREWIVCERSGRWAAALRIAVARQRAGTAAPPRLREVRHLAELQQHHSENRHALCLIEVDADNFDQVLTWLAEAGRRRPTICSLALLTDDDGFDGAEPSPAGDARRRDAIEALREAGVLDVVQSPRHVRRVIALADRHGARSVHYGIGDATEQPLTEWVASRLPWQD